MLHLSVLIHLAVTSPSVPRPHRRGRGDAGQATAEYALVLLGAAAVGLLLAAWAVRSGKVTDLLDAVIDKILDQV